MTDELLPDDDRDLFDDDRFLGQREPVGELADAVREHVAAELGHAFALDDFLERLVIPGDREVTAGVFAVVRWRARLRDEEGPGQIEIPRTRRTFVLDGVTIVWEEGGERLFLDHADWTRVQAQLGVSSGRPVLR